MFNIIGQVFAIAIATGLTVIVWTGVFAFQEISKYMTKEKKFEWSYKKLLLSYKIKILTQDIIKRNVKMEELHEIITEALDQKVNKKHVLDQIEEEVRGDLEEIKKVK